MNYPPQAGMHRFQARFWPFFNRCRICGLDRSADTHPQTLAGPLQEIRNLARRIDIGPRSILSANEITLAIIAECDRHDTEYTWMDRPLDTVYKACSRGQFIGLVRDHYFNIFPKSQLEFQDCDDLGNWVSTWCAVVGVTALAKVYDYGSPLPHVYNMIVHSDKSVTFFDGGPTHFPRPPEGVKYQFKERVKLHV